MGAGGLARSAPLLRGLLQRLERLSNPGAILQQPGVGPGSICACISGASSSRWYGGASNSSTNWPHDDEQHHQQQAWGRQRRRSRPRTEHRQPRSRGSAAGGDSQHLAFDTPSRRLASLRALSTGTGGPSDGSKPGPDPSATLLEHSFHRPSERVQAPVARSTSHGGGIASEGETTDADMPLELLAASDFLAYPMHQRAERRKQELTFEVIDFFPDGHAVELMRPRTASELELHPRELGLFAPLARLSAPQRATIAVRERKILFKTEVAKAIISADKAVLIKSRKEKEVHRLASDLMKAAKETSNPLPFEMRMLDVLLSSTAEYFIKKTQHLNWMMESIGDEIRQPKRPFLATDKAHQLIPIQKFLTAIKNDVRETCEAIVKVLEDDLPDLCLTYKRKVQRQLLEQQKRSANAQSLASSSQYMPGATASTHSTATDSRPQAAHSNDSSSPGSNGTSSMFCAVNHAQQEAAVLRKQQHMASAHALQQERLNEAKKHVEMKMAEEMLETYEREFRSLEGSLAETEENLDNTRQLWHMQLDSSRNYIMLANLWISVGAISVMITTLLPAFFGMNLDSGLSDKNPAAFYGVMATSICLAAISFPLARELYYRNWRRQAHQELFEQKMLRVLLVQHIDDLDDIVHALGQVQGKLDRQGFRDIVHKTLGPRAMAQSNIDFLYQAFDSNKDGFLSEAEMMQQLAIHRLSGHMDDGNGGSSSSNSRGLDVSRKIRQTPERPGNGGGDKGARASSSSGEGGQQRPGLYQEMDWGREQEDKWD